MLVVGSRALEYHGVLVNGRKPVDKDIICTYEEYEKLIDLFDLVKYYPISGNKFVGFSEDKKIYEFEIAWENTTAASLLSIVEENGLFTENEFSVRFATPDVVLSLKLSHRYLKNSKHFKKTMDDIRYLRSKGYVVPTDLILWLKQREKETYNYQHPKLNQHKSEFFDTEGVTYTYDHDSLHKAVALKERPAYLEYKPEDRDVWCCEKMFRNLSKEVQLNGVFEEAAVLALERCLIPNNFTIPQKQAFKMALEKVCTSITSGWFREFAWENYEHVLAMYKTGYIAERFMLGLEKKIIRRVDAITHLSITTE